MENILFQPEPIVWVQQLFGYGHPLPFRILDLFAATWGVLFTIGLALWLWGREDAYSLAAIMIAEAMINLGLNRLLSVPRPSAPEIVKYETIQLGSFPSGHVFTVTVLWGLLWARGRVPLWLSALLVLGVGLGRLYIGVHYLADIIAGAALGVLLVWSFHRVLPRLRDSFVERSYDFFVGTGLLGLAAVGGGFFWVAGSNPFLWNSLGLLAGGIVALLLEYRYVRYAPVVQNARGTTIRILVGLAGLAPLVLVDRLSGERALALGAISVFLGALWALLATPALLVRWDRARARSSHLRESAWHATRVVGFTVLGVLAALLTYGTVIEPRLIMDVEAQTAPIPGLPAEWDGRVIAVTGDFQIGMWWSNTGMIRKVADRIMDERPAAVLLTGDFIYHPGEDPGPEVAAMREILRPVAESGIPVYAVLGNHDWGLRAQRGEPNPAAARMVRQALGDLGITLLHNDAIPIRGAGSASRLYVVGIGSRYADEDRPVEALQSVPDGAPRVVFMHHPDSFESIPAGAAPLAVAGHTHGGQIALPFTPEWSWLTFAREDEVHADGWIDERYGARGNRLYVNRGIGFSVVPIRIGAAPELTLFRLERSQRRGDHSE